ncbi:hypothetical protein BW716_10205 [[Flexibacter] sp. ATCC 35208]|nr:hypothetical protein BW716_10205 [[Flexibacter] sp. ATCC 35208]
MGGAMVSACGLVFICDSCKGIKRDTEICPKKTFMKEGIHQWGMNTIFKENIHERGYSPMVNEYHFQRKHS